MALFTVHRTNRELEQFVRPAPTLRHHCAVQTVARPVTVIAATVTSWSSSTNRDWDRSTSHHRPPTTTWWHSDRRQRHRVVERLLRDKTVPAQQPGWSEVTAPHLTTISYTCRPSVRPQCQSSCRGLCLDVKQDHQLWISRAQTHHGGVIRHQQRHSSSSSSSKR